MKNLKLRYIQLAIYLNLLGYQYFYQFMIDKQITDYINNDL